MIQLRDYQQDLVDGVQAALTSEQARVMMQLPTGGGKTVIAGALLIAWLKGGRKAVWLTHRKELAAQTRDLLVNANVPASVDNHWNPGEDAPARQHAVTILMAQTVSRRTAKMSVWRNYGRDDLMIIDEAHHASAVGWTRAVRQWPGRILGMTATPWRLSQKEGFDHLFSALLCGPAVEELQSGDHLCGTQVLRPSSQWIIHGGAVGMDGDFTDAGIEAANQNHIMTAGALKFWQEYAQDRQTIVYAVSVDHAHNLVAVFRNAGVQAAVMLGETGDEERSRLITTFKRGNLRILVNVAVATEGFDLPDASCVVITRPTKSLTLYLQMVGRGLRPKKDNGNCLILDLAANAELHGLPEDDREWSLEPRAAQEDIGDAVTVWCDSCNTVSPAASHTCQNCGAPFGKDCSRCGTWRAWKRWSLEKQCGDAHQLVCDLCHRDAHIEARLPIDEQLEAALTELEDKEAKMLSLNHILQDPNLNSQLFGLPYEEMLEVLKEDHDFHKDESIQYWQEREHSERLMLEEELGPELTKRYDRSTFLGLLYDILTDERRTVVSVVEERQHELLKVVEEREAMLANEFSLEALFEVHVSNLPANQRPQSNLQKYRLFPEWEDKFRSELIDWKDEFARLKNQPIDNRLIFHRSLARVLGLFCRVAQDIDLLPDASDLGTGMKPSSPQRESGSPPAKRAPQKRLRGRRKGAGKTRRGASKIAKKIKSAGGSYADIEKELAERGFANTKGMPYRGVSAIYSLLNL